MDERDNGDILFFDGVCNTCNGFVSLLLKIDSHGRLMFAPLQGEAARQLLPSEDFTAMGSLVFRDRSGNLSRYSDAVVAVCAILPWPWKVLSILALIPKSLRDWIYRIVARNRYRLFGKRSTCRVPTGEERDRFLD